MQSGQELCLTGVLIQIDKKSHSFTTLVGRFNQLASSEFIGNTAYVASLADEIWKIDQVSRPPFSAKG